MPAKPIRIEALKKPEPHGEAPAPPAVMEERALRYFRLVEEGASPARILIVDDDASFGKMVRDVITRCTGLDCRFVKSAPEALEFMEREAVDVVVTDIKMPAMTGIELTRLIKAGYDAEVIVVTGYYEDFTYEDAIENGADDFIEKPLKPTELILRLKRVLRERALSRKRRQAEESLMESEKRYRDIFDRALEGIFQATTEGRFITVNRAFSAMLGYESPEDLMASVKQIRTQLYFRPEDQETFLDILGKTGFINRHEVRLRRKDGKHIWVSANMVSVNDREGRLLYYEGNVEDISPRKEAEKERAEVLARLRKALGATVHALAMTAEIRDPYTAGHQRRVAELARTIATEMGLEAERIDGLRMASTIHDIGKISVPAEILSMPRKLTDTEFSLIKTHAQSGCDILKDIDFPWPIARMVLEHHERIDGSGYPQGLKGDNILMESRIIAVADVVEAMASYRPYRPALGIETALEEISAKRGIFYDPSVADACLRLFREKGFALPT